MDELDEHTKQITLDVVGPRSPQLSEVGTKRCPKCGLELPDSTVVCPQDGTSLLTQPGTILADSYEFLSETGRGGMSVIYRARELKTDKVVAIKMMRSVSTTDEAVRRFVQEVKAISSLKHPNIISVHDSGVTELGQPYMVMDFIEGKNLGDAIKEKGALSLEESLHRFIQLCDALAHAHDVGVLHRDLKPGNIMLSSSDGNFEDARLVDFGIAKLLDQEGEDVGHLTQTGQLFGSPLYMSPEQCRAGRVDARTDIYSMGCVMYETLTGRPPFKGATIVETIVAQMNETPKKLSEARPDKMYSQALENIIAKTLAKDPADRFQTMRDLEFALMQMRPDPKVSSEQLGRGGIGDKLSIPKFVYGAFGIFAISVAFLSWNTWTTRGHANQSTSTSHVSLVDARALQQARRKLLAVIKRDLLDEDTFVECLPSFTSESTLNLEGAKNLSDAALEKVATLKSLSALSLAGTGAGRNTLKGLAGLTKLQSLDLSNTAVEDADLASLTVMPDLRNLSLTGTKVTNGGMSTVAQLKVYSLSLANTSVDDAGLAKLSAMPLGKLDLSGTKVSDSGLAAVSKMKDLRELSLNDTHIGDDGLKHLQNLEKLEKLVLNRSKITNQGLAYLVHLKGLKTLTVAETDIGDPGMVYVQQFPSLVDLDLAKTKITDKGIGQLSQIGTLYGLHLKDTKITDLGIHALIPMKNLESVELSGTDITDAGLDELSKHQRLYYVNLSDCSGITTSGIEKLAKELPKCKVACWKSY